MFKTAIVKISRDNGLLNRDEQYVLSKLRSKIENQVSSRLGVQQWRS